MRPFLLALFLAGPCGFIPAQQVQNAGALLNLFRQAVVADSFADMKSLVEMNRDKVDEAFFNLEVQWCGASLSEAAAENAAQHMRVLEMLGQMNKLYGNRTGWLEDRLAWLLGLSPEKRKAKVDAWNGMADAYAIFDKVRTTRTTEFVRPGIDAYQTVFDKSKEAGDEYWMANSCLAIGKLYEYIPDWFSVTYWYKLGASLGAAGGHAANKIMNFNLDAGVRTAASTGKIRAELIDVQAPLDQSRKAYDEALAAGVSAGGGDEGAPAATGVFKGMPPPPNKFPEGTDMGWVEHTDFKVSHVNQEPDWDPPLYQAAVNWLFWQGVAVDREEVKPFAALPGDTVLENDKGKIIVHPGGKGKGRPMPLKVSNRPALVEFKDVPYLDGSKGTLFHWMLKRPSTINIMGASMRSAGTAEVIHFKGASLVRGEVRGHTVEIHDVDGNGSFNDFGRDAIVVGKGRDVQVEPLSKFVNLGGHFYELRVEANGRTVRSKPYDGALAAVKLDYKGNKKPANLLVQGAGTEATYVVDLMAALDSPIWVVPTTFRIVSGYISEGKGDRRDTIQITPGRSGTWEVQAGSLETIELGGAGQGFRLHATPETRTEKGNQIVYVPGTSVKIYGAGGEEYSRSFFGRVLPEIWLSKGKEERAQVREKMRAPDRGQTNMETIFYPGDIEIKKPWKGDYQIKLIADYPPLGKMESDWITGN